MLQGEVIIFWLTWLAVLEHLWVPMSPSLQTYAAAWLDSGDQDAATHIVDMLYPQVVRIVQNHLPRNRDAEDLAQEVFIQFFRTLHRWEPPRPLENWVSRLAMNVCLNALRAQRRRPEWRWSDLSAGEVAVVELLLNQSVTTVPDDGAFGGELLSKLLDALAPQERMILTMLHLEEKSVAEIALLTGWNATLVKVRAFRARSKLRGMLAELREGKSME